MIQDGATFKYMENKLALELTFKSFIFHYNVVLIKRILSIILETFEANLNKIVPLQYFA